MKPRPVLADDAIVRVLIEEIPGFADMDRARGWSDLGVDSFDLLTLRAACETALGVEFSDRQWESAQSADQLIELAGQGAHPVATRVDGDAPFVESIDLGMSQMAMGGLSESWLLKTLGDLHWRQIAEALGTPARDIRDGEGHRLYAAFARVRFRSNVPLASFVEGERLTFRARLACFGPGIFFSTVDVGGEDGRHILAELMSSFVRRGDPASNAGLVRGQPSLARCAAPALDTLPAFGLGYQERRRERGTQRPALASTRYDILPTHDINGVGLLYFAAYPIISDICRARAAGQDAGAAARISTVERDVCYFANADAGAPLEWRLHGEAGGLAETGLIRADGEPLAWIGTRAVSV